MSVYNAMSTLKKSLSLIIILGKNVRSVMTDRMTSGTSRESLIFPVKKNQVMSQTTVRKNIS